MSRPMWFVSILKKNFKNRFAIADLTKKVPFFRKFIDNLLFKEDNVIYLPKDHTVTPQTQTETPVFTRIQIQQPVGVAPDGTPIHNDRIQVRELIAAPESILLPSQVVEHFIRESKYHYIMNECICRSSNQCEDYPINLGCLFLGKPVEQINPKLGRPVTMEEALEHARRCREAGLFHMIGRNKLDTVWMGVKPGNRLLTICNCCPCCCLYKVLPNLEDSISARVHKMPGVEVLVNENCIACGQCAQEGVCFVNAIHIEDGRAVISDACRGCGHCVDVCPNGAIEIRVDSDYVQKTIEELTPYVNVK